jgi:hypothetical protein
MNCQLVDKYLYSYCDNTLPPGIGPSLGAHLKDCAKCRNKIALTKLENDLLREGYGIPELSHDFTQKVMKSIELKSQPVSPSIRILRRLSNRAYMPNSSSKIRYPKLFLTSSLLAAALFIALLIPGLNHFGLKTTEESYHKNEIAETRGSQADEANNSPSPAPKRDLTDNGKTSDRGEASIMAYHSEEGTSKARWGDPEELYPFSVRDVRDSRHGDLAFRAKTAEGIFYLQPSNLPVEYNLTEIICDANNKLTFRYSHTVTNQDITVSLADLEMEDPTLESMSSLPKSEYVRSISSANDAAHDQDTQDTSNTISWNLPYKGLSLSITVTGNLSAEELTRIAQSIQFKEAQGNDSMEELE